MKMFNLRRGLSFATLLLVFLQCSAQGAATSGVGEPTDSTETKSSKAERAVVAAEAGAFENEMRVSFDPKPPENSDIPSVDYDFGKVDQLDDSPSEEELKYSDEFKGTEQYLIGKKHTFFLYNHGKKPVGILFVATGDPCLDARVPEGDKFLRFPRTIPVGGKLPVMVAFNWETAAAGTFHGQVDFIAGENQDVIATIYVTAEVEGGIHYKPRTLDFGKFAAGSNQVRHGTLTIDKRITDHLWPHDTLRLASISRDFTVSFDKQPNRKDVKVSENSIYFNDRLVRDLTCAFTVKVAPGAPLGTLISKISLASDAGPNLMIMVTNGVPVRAVQVGHMKPIGSDVINFGIVDPRSSASRSISIACALPVLPSSLKVSSSSSDVTAGIVTVTSKGGGTSSPSNIATLEVKINPNAKLGQRDAVLFVTNSFNQEKLKFRIYSSLVNQVK